MAKETKTINLITEKDMQKIAKGIVDEWFDKGEFSPSVRRNIKIAIIDGIKEAIAKQDGLE